MVCRSCHFQNAPKALTCNLCGELLVPPQEEVRREEAQAFIPFRPTGGGLLHGNTADWLHVVIGLGLSGFFTLTHTLRMIGWVVGALFHETGHFVAALMMGCPAVPTISLTGEAMTLTKGQSPFFVCGVLAVLAWASYLSWKHKVCRMIMGVLVLLFFLLAFQETSREIFILASGHLGELLFAFVFFIRAQTGAFIKTQMERPLYACLAWYLTGSNLYLFFGLVCIPSVQRWYASSGSHGLTNDFIRIANRLDCDLALVAVLMLLCSIAVFPAAWLMSHALIRGGVRELEE